MRQKAVGRTRYRPYELGETEAFGPYRAVHNGSGGISNKINSWTIPFVLFVLARAGSKLLSFSIIPEPDFDEDRFDDWTRQTTHSASSPDLLVAIHIAHSSWNLHQCFALISQDVRKESPDNPQLLEVSRISIQTTWPPVVGGEFSYGERCASSDLLVKIVIHHNLSELDMIWRPQLPMALWASGN